MPMTHADQRDALIWTYDSTKVKRDAMLQGCEQYW